MNKNELKRININYNALNFHCQWNSDNTFAVLFDDHLIIYQVLLDNMNDYNVNYTSFSWLGVSIHQQQEHSSLKTTEIKNMIILATSNQLHVKDINAWNDIKYSINLDIIFTNKDNSITS